MRTCALVGTGLVAVSIVMSNFSPFDKAAGDMRAIIWSGAAAIVLAGGILLLLIALALKLRRIISSV